MIIKILTLFPGMFTGFVGESIIKRAIDRGLCKIEIIDIREYSLDKHHHVDDTPCGGGSGMILACDVVCRALKANSRNSYKIMMSPQGNTYTQAKALKLATLDEISILCGHYEGFDERIRSYVDEEISIGDYVLTGGEIPSMVLADSVIRLLDNVIKEESHLDDSFSNGLLEYPQYTRPIEYEGKKVPDVLLSGNHKLINQYRRKESLVRTYLRRPDLLEKISLSSDDIKLLNEGLEELKNEK